MSKNTLQKLELTWIGKDEERENIEPRILIEAPKYSYGDTDSGNMLIHGDNLLALKALEQEYSGRIKCIYIDPPYNTGSAFDHYDDNLEHSIWLSLMKSRLEFLRCLLSNDGSLWINLDDNEVHYCKILCDEIFGRNNFLCDISWEKRYSPAPDTKDFGYIHDHILVYRKTNSFKRNLLPLTEDQSGRYKNPDNDPRGPWKAADYTCRFSSEQRPNLYYPIIQPISGEEIWPKKNRVWANSKEEHEKNIREKRLWWGMKGTNSVPAKKNFLSEIQQGMMPMSLWHYQMAGTNQDAKKESLKLFGNNPFDTPKPEKLVQIILKIATNPGDLVLDSFLGSGTTAAVAQKMGRRYIGIELGNHAYTHCYPRLKMVTDGTDQGGISKAQNWKGGSGFKFYELAPSLLKEDRFGNLVINKEYNADMLAAAMAKQEGYTYQPDTTLYWKQGQSSEHDYIYTTTQFLTVESLDAISETMQEGESLLICCTAFQKECATHHPNITVKKIPQMLLGRCEFNKDNYNLNIIDMPKMDDEEDPDEDYLTEPAPQEVEEDNKNNQPTLFD